MKSITVYHTHIEVKPYTPGENPKIEKMFSTWDAVSFKFNPIAFHVEDDILYLPRGTNILMLKKEFGAEPLAVRTPDPIQPIKKCEMVVEPRDEIQIESTNFLLGLERFKSTKYYSQQSLNLDTGDGKTFCAIYFIIKNKEKAIIITHVDKIKQQWISSFNDMTDINHIKIASTESAKSRLVDIDGSDMIEKIMNGKIKTDGDVYFVNHQTLNSYGRTYGWYKLHEFFKYIGVGVKIYDEAHLEFKNIIKVDMFSNTKKTIYLTANFNRSDPVEARIFERSFSNVYKFGEETKDYGDKRRHIVYLPVLYRSGATELAQAMCRNQFGFSVKGFIDYAMSVDENKTILLKLERILEMATKLSGKILVLSPKIETTDMLRHYIMSLYYDRVVSTIHSKNSELENKIALEADIICSTIKSCGTGMDIKGLRVVINLEPFSSEITANQVAGRLREYSKTEDTYFFDLVDIDIPQCVNMYKTRLRFLKKKCKKISVYHL